MSSKKGAILSHSGTTEKWNRKIRADIRRLANQIVERFSPAGVILFGSHAQGQADPDSDVDLLVILPDDAKLVTSLDIRRAVSCDIPLDILVYSRQALEQRVSAGDFFLRDALDTGVVLYEKPGE
ncbi:MAG: nucleotidyltransferase domain-containing protein [Phycisphaerae bacterium]|nr:nucleotidyltransferase domain-containing protein [Phycisphaerae bacterium]